MYLQVLTGHSGRLRYEREQEMLSEVKLLLQEVDASLLRPDRLYETSRNWVTGVHETI